jgi:hypothetical protein
MPTTASQAVVSTGTTIKTMLQVATPSTRQMEIISWGWNIDACPPGAANSGEVELIQTDVAATVTAHVAAGVQPLDPNAPASLMTLGVTATGYTSSGEGAITATRVFDVDQVTDADSGAGPVEGGYQFMPDERPVVAVSKFLRVRAKFSSAVNMICWVVWDE